ncbi:MAG: Rrf2 family transcriptional regulator [Opitutales bacterium]|nr:Rrf2 family transcriptional regulator [Opitutales bacterium]
MLALSTSFNYALRALSVLEKGETETTFVKDLAKAADVPAPYLAKIFTRLATAGLIEAKRGWKGGNRLTRPADEITLFDLAEALEEDRWLDTCLLGQEECTDRRACPTHEFWKVERRRIANQLRETTLAEAIVFEQQRKDKAAKKA